jgi:hypothetical protein
LKCYFEIVGFVGEEFDLHGVHFDCVEDHVLSCLKAGLYGQEFFGKVVFLELLVEVSDEISHFELFFCRRDPQAPSDLLVVLSVN